MNLRSFVTYSWKMRPGADCPAAATSSRLVVAMVETTCTGTQQLVRTWGQAVACVQHVVGQGCSPDATAVSQQGDTLQSELAAEVLLHGPVNRGLLWWRRPASTVSGCVEQDTCGRQQLCQQPPESD